MDWTLSRNVARDVVAKARLFETFGGGWKVDGMDVGHDREAWTTHQRDVLGIAGVAMEVEALRAAAGRALPRACAPTAALAGVLSGCRMDEVAFGLCHHLGVDPLRLVMAAAFTGEAAATRGDQRIAVGIRREDGAVTVAIGVRLSPTVSWRDGRVTIRGGALPAVARTALTDETIDRIVDHDWGGWRGVRVVKAWANGPSTELGTNAAGTVRLAA